jgi:hypothetical protein
MSAKHTPGPWRWVGPNQLWGGEREADEILKAEDDRKPYGAHSPLIEHHWDWDVAEANRNLIAAAPDLLAVLQAVRAANPMMGADLGAMVDAAILKATNGGAA